MTSEIRTNTLTSRAGLSTVTLTDSGPMFSGITTFVDNSTFSVGTGGTIHAPATNTLNIGVNNTESLRIDSNSNLKVAGIVTATHFYGNGANLSGLPAGTTINSNTNNYVVTATGTANTLQGEANLTFDGINLKVGNTFTAHTAADNLVIGTTSGSNGMTILTGSATGTIFFNDGSGNDGAIQYVHSSSPNYMRLASSGQIEFDAGGSERLRIDSDGRLIQRYSAAPYDNRAATFQSPAGQTSTYIAVVNTETNGASGILFGDHAGQNAGNFDAYINYSHQYQHLQFLVGSGTERVRIRASGQVQFSNGTFSDNVDCIMANGGTMEIGAQSVMKFRTATNERLRITSSDATLSGTTDGVLNITTTDSRGSFIRFQQAGTSKVWVGCGQGLSLGSASDLGLRSTSHLRIRTGAEEHMFVSDTGYLSVKGEAGNWVYGNHPSNYSFHQLSSSKNGDWMLQLRQEHHNGLGFVMRVANNGNNEAIALYRENVNTYGFKVYQNGNVQNSNNSYGSLSDVSLKENIVDANSQWDDIKAIKVRNFNLKSDADKVKMLGVVAQELETVSPKLVFEDKEGVKGVHYSVLYMKAIKALQEAITKIETLEQDNIALRARVTNLEGN